MTVANYTTTMWLVGGRSHNRIIPQVIAKLVEELNLAAEDAYIDPATTHVIVSAEGDDLLLTAYALAEPLGEDGQRTAA